MKTSLVFTALAAVSTVSAYQCPPTSAVNEACRSINVFPLICNNPQVNVEPCNAKQCNQPYIDNYSACQCRRSPTMFYEHSANVEGLLRRCGMAGLANPFGNPNQYKPGQGTQVFAPTTSALDLDGATRIYDGTTYYGGQTSVIDGTTRIVSATAVVGGTQIVSGTTTWSANTPGIVGGSSTRWVPPPTHAPATRTAAPIVEPTSVPVYNTNHHISGGSVAGIVLGLLAATALAGLLGWCWRKKRHEHMAVYNTYAAHPGGPTRTVVTEKVEPVVVRAGHLPGTATNTASTSYNTTTGSSTHLPHTTTTTTTTPVTHVNGHVTAPVHHPTTTATMGNAAYTTHPRTGADVVPHTVHNANNVNTHTNTTTTTH